MTTTIPSTQSVNPVIQNIKAQPVCLRYNLKIDTAIQEAFNRTRRAVNNYGTTFAAISEGRDTLARIHPSGRTFVLIAGQALYALSSLAYFSAPVASATAHFAADQLVLLVAPLNSPPLAVGSILTVTGIFFAVFGGLFFASMRLFSKMVAPYKVALLAHPDFIAARNIREMGKIVTETVRAKDELQKNWTPLLADFEKERVQETDLKQSAKTFWELEISETTTCLQSTADGFREKIEQVAKEFDLYGENRYLLNFLPYVEWV